MLVEDAAFLTTIGGAYEGQDNDCLDAGGHGCGWARLLLSGCRSGGVQVLTGVVEYARSRGT